MRFGLVKSGLDAHTLGISSLASLIQGCGLPVCIADSTVCEAGDKAADPVYFKILKSWLLENRITHLGYSYRLDPQQGVRAFSVLMNAIDRDPDISPLKDGALRSVSFAGLPETCRLVQKEYQARIPVFAGDETPVETLSRLGIPENLIPNILIESSQYDELRLEFGRQLLSQEAHLQIPTAADYDYADFGTTRDHLLKRLEQAAQKKRLPLMRTHVGPYLPDREEALALFSDWLKRLREGGLLDIMSVGSSQLSQSHFGEDWDDLPNGGGVPFNSPLELKAIREDASPMLVRAYSATSSIPRVAGILEENLNMAWHALSLWWFNRIDGRGPLSVEEGLRQHLETLRLVARWKKPFEPNVPHHFSFRGADDISYILSAYLAARTAKSLGIRWLVLPNMLNTPKATWGIRDLAKSRAMLRLVRRLEDRRFRVIFQPRAGLDYFSPDLDKARIQLAAVSALMADVEPQNPSSPEIVHVVGFSEAVHLADPRVIQESIRITRAALRLYPQFRDRHGIRDIITDSSLDSSIGSLCQDAGTLIADMEHRIPGLYSPQGLYQVFLRGYFPVPFLWEGREEFARAVEWKTRILEGGVHVVDDRGKKMSIPARLERIRRLFPESGNQRHY